MERQELLERTGTIKFFKDYIRSRETGQYGGYGFLADEETGEEAMFRWPALLRAGICKPRENGYNGVRVKFKAFPGRDGKKPVVVWMAAIRERPSKMEDPNLRYGR